MNIGTVVNTPKGLGTIVAKDMQTKGANAGQYLYQVRLRRDNTLKYYNASQITKA